MTYPPAIHIDSLVREPADLAAEVMGDLFADDVIGYQQVVEYAALRRLGCPPMLAVRIVCTAPDTLAEVLP